MKHLFLARLLAQAVAYIHMDGVFHGQLTLENVPLGSLVSSFLLYQATHCRAAPNPRRIWAPRVIADSQA